MFVDNEPNPRRYEIIQSWQYGIYLVLKIKYLNCSNYERIKILVYEQCTLPVLLEQGSIDPSFNNSKSYYSPIAKFEPSARGQELALQFAHELHVKLRDHPECA